MKSLVVALLAVLGLTLSTKAMAFVPNKMHKAFLNVCAAEAVGCSHTISIEGNTYPVEVDTGATAAASWMDKLIAVHQLLELPNTAPFLAGGYFVVKGLFPNPMSEQLVFVVTNIDGVVMPRSLE